MNTCDRPGCGRPLAPSREGDPDYGECFIHGPRYIGPAPLVQPSQMEPRMPSGLSKAVTRQQLVAGGKNLRGSSARLRAKKETTSA